MKTIKITSNNGYLNMLDLPHNCIFNKVITGCGGTTIALFNDCNYVIAVPTTELIINKTGLEGAGISKIKSPYDKSEIKVFGLFGTFSYNVKKLLKEYLSYKGIKKIMCTYDKIDSLSKIIKSSNFRLLVDEYHILLKAYSYRYSAINGIFNNYNKYKSYCFMSATPISPEFKPKALEDVEEIYAEWDNVDRLFVSLERTNKPYIKVANIINSYKVKGYIEYNGNKSYEALFFINSVTDIVKILNYCNLTNDEVKIICANTEANHKKLEGYTISNSKGSNKKFTFITSKSFEGADFFSDTGICYVVSNSSNVNTLLDISTDIYQIAGRIRTSNNPFRNIIIHIFNTTGKRKINLTMSYDEIVDNTYKELKGAEELLKLVNCNSSIKSAAEKLLNKDYIIKDSEGKYYINDVLIKLELFTYKLEQDVYKNGISIARYYKSNNIDIKSEVSKIFSKDIKNSVKKISFKEAFLKYSILIKDPFYIGDDINNIIRIQPLVPIAYNKLGESRVKKLRYVRKSIESALLNLEYANSSEYRIAKSLNSSISYGFISIMNLKKLLSRTYSTLKITKTVKSSDIEKYFDCKKTTKRINSKVVKGYEIYRNKILYQ